MLFDKMCRIAEREIPELEKKLRSIKLFHFPGIPHEFLPKEIDDDILVFLREQFMLPFQSIAIEDDAGLVIIEDIEKNARGINQERKFIDVVRLNSPENVFRDEAEEDARKNTEMKEWVRDQGMLDYDPLCFAFGSIESVEYVDSHNFLTQVRMDRVVIAYVKPFRKKHIFADYDRKELDKLPELSAFHVKSAGINAMTAMQEILYANTPNKFILEISPSLPKTKKKKKKKRNIKINRSDDRKKYILLKPKEIRKIIKEDIPNKGSGRKSPKIHERRAHPRTFRSDKFVNMQGKTIMIPAKWIGVSEKTVGNKRYKVMLDM